MSDVVGDTAGGAAGDLVRIRLHGSGRPDLGQEQPPVDRSRGMIRGHVQGDAHLAVGDLARGAGVLPRHTRRGVSVLEEPVSSKTSAVGRIAFSVLQASRARTCAGSHGLVVMKWAKA